MANFWHLAVGQITQWFESFEFSPDQQWLATLNKDSGIIVFKNSFKMFASRRRCFSRFHQTVNCLLQQTTASFKYGTLQLGLKNNNLLSHNQ